MMGNGIYNNVATILFVEWDYTNEVLTFPLTGLTNVLYIEKNSKTMWFYDGVWKSLSGLYN